MEAGLEGAQPGCGAPDGTAWEGARAPAQSPSADRAGDGAITHPPPQRGCTGRSMGCTRAAMGWDNSRSRATTHWGPTQVPRRRSWIHSRPCLRLALCACLAVSVFPGRFILLPHLASRVTLAVRADARDVIIYLSTSRPSGPGQQMSPPSPPGLRTIPGFGQYIKVFF